VARDNLLVKIPATAAGVGAIETLTGEGVSINVTLMFSLAHVEAVAGAYQRGLEKLAAAGGDIARVRSVASVFLSRWDSLIDKQLDEIGTPRPSPCAARPAWPWPARPTSATSRASTAQASPRWPPRAAARKACCGPAPAPRTRPTPT
jgi:hypothetical protein